MAYTQADANAIRASLLDQAIYGLDTYQIDGMSLKFMTPEQRLELLRVVEADVEASNGRSRIHFACVRPGG
jgi:hypothetical protein